MCLVLFMIVCFFNDPATTEIYTYGHTLSLHDALPIFCPERINCNGSGKSAVDAARQTQDDSGKAIAVHIIAEAKHHRAIDIFWVRIGYGAFARRADPAALHVPDRKSVV